MRLCRVTWNCRRSQNFAHVAVVYSGHLPIVPGDRNRVPTGFGDDTTIGGIAPPIIAGTLREGHDLSTVIIAPGRLCRTEPGEVV